MTPTDGIRAGMPHARRVATLILLATLFALAPATRDARAEIGNPAVGGCLATKVVGLDGTRSDGVQFIRLSRGLAQVFVASDTLVRTVTLWLPATRRLLTTPLHLYVFATDGDGRPQPDSAVLDGGSLDGGDADGSQAARFTYVFDPPAMLPAPGRYALVLVPDRCSAIPVLTDGSDSFSDGDLWEMGQRRCGGPLTTLGERLTGTHLTFRVEFCDGGTVTTGHTWGELKTLYR
ncbi:MAG: hypothetical protein ACHQ52_05355 [Candidatus Eisenbacteria bacterium]